MQARNKSFLKIYVLLHLKLLLLREIQSSALKESVKLFVYLLISPMRIIFSIVVLILYTGLTFTYLTILQTTAAQVQLPTTTSNVTLLNKTATNDTVSNSNNDTIAND